MGRLNLLFAFLITTLLSNAQSDDCSGAPNLPVNTSCSYQAFSITENGQPEPGAASPPCIGAGSPSSDGWYTVTGTGSPITITIDNPTRQCKLAVYTDCTQATSLDCQTVPNGGNTSATFPTTLGTTYYVQIMRSGGAANADLDGNICATSAVSGSNDDPCGATPLIAGASCTYVSGTTVGSTNTTGVPAPGCASYSGPDVWYSVIVPPTGAIVLDMTAGTTTDSGLALYTSSGGCSGAFTLVECDDDDGVGTMSNINNNTLTPGTTVYVRAWDYGGGTGTFNICAREATACGGGAASNDYCPTAAILTSGPGSFSANTSATYTADLPGNVGSVFCGSIENNSWYMFTASATTASFPFTSVSGCTNGWGVQAQVYNVTSTAMGCCNTFASVSNCYNPGTTTLGTVNATGLTVGNTYLLMIDGNAGDACNFTISGWTATGILPVVVSQFSGDATEFGNLIQWQTESETKSDYFEVMFSRDANEFSSIGIIQAAGTTTQQQQYSFMHQGAPTGTSFYQLKQVDLNGEVTYSDIISVKSNKSDGGLFSVFPNPFGEKLSLALQAEKQTTMQIEIYDNAGKMIFSDEVSIYSGTTHYYIDTKTLEQGSYQLVVKSGETINTQRIIK